MTVRDHINWLKSNDSSKLSVAKVSGNELEVTFDGVTAELKILSDGSRLDNIRDSSGILWDMSEEWDSDAWQLANNLFIKYYERLGELRTLAGVV